MYTRRTQVAGANQYDLRCFERVLQLRDHLLGPSGQVFDPLLALLVPQLPEQQERDEHERDGQQDVRLDNVQQMED
jgi:hypothetical protein